jgi:aryl-alcohol dehydrogenase-like predicted oxidoreductase
LLTVLATIARRHDVGVGSVAIRSVLDRPQVAAAIVGATSARQLSATLQASTLRLDEDEVGAIEQVLSHASGPSGEVYALERERDSKHARIMRYELNKP